MTIAPIPPFTSAPAPDQFGRFVGMWFADSAATVDGQTVLTLRPMGRASARYLMLPAGVQVTEIRGDSKIVKDIEAARRRTGGTT